ncbi:MAG: DUF2459 domain-containing protein [Gammaproteobacteria bacterium]
MEQRTGRYHGNKPAGGIPRFLLLLLCFQLGGCHADTLVLEPVEAADAVTIYVASHGWHTGIIVGKTAAMRAIPSLPQFFEKARAIEFGWGDHDFYQSAEISYGLALKALLFPTDAVLHVAAISKPPKVYFSRSKVVDIRISKAGFDKMLLFFQQSFKRDSRGGLIRLGRGLYADSLFFAAHGSYHAFYTCNSWIMEALVVAGLPEPALPTLTAESVMEQVDRFRAASLPLK